MRVFLTLTLIVCLASCSAVNDEKVVTDFYDIGGLETSCTLSGDQFRKILEENIETDINCLESSLKQFAEYVRRENPLYIKRSELEKFINKFFPESASEINKILKPAYKLISILLKDPPDKIAVKNIPLLANIVRIMNQQGRELSKTLKIVIEKKPTDRDETDEQRDTRIKGNAKRYWEYKAQILRTTRSMVGSFIAVISKRPDNNNTLDVPLFLEELKVALELSDEDFDITTIKSYLFIKKLIIGGNINTLGAVEIKPLINKVPNLLEVAMDTLYSSERPAIPGDEITVDIDKSKFLMELVKKARALMFAYTDQEETVLEFDNLTKVLKNVMDDVDWDKVSASLINFKSKIIGGDSKKYSYNDFNTLFDLIRQAFEISYFNNLTYRHFALVMKSERPVEGILLPSLPEYSQFSQTRITEMWGNFLFVAKNYHFFLNRDGYQTIGFKIKRNSYGFNILSLMRWGVQKLFVEYGGSNPNDPSQEFVLDLDDARLIASEYKGLLEELELWPDDLERLLSELRLGSDLFRMNSNGDNLIQIDEVNEYISTLIFSGKIKDDIMKVVGDSCIDIGTAENPAYDINCFNQHFFDILFKQLENYKYLPNLHDFYLKHKGTDFLITFLEEVQKKARIINDSSVPIDATDISRTITSLSNTETLFKRFDFNQNHEIKDDEVDAIYGVVETVIASANDSLEPGADLTKSAFLYVVKNETLPSGIGLILFHINPLAKLGIKADRLKIARVLSLF